MFTFVSSEAMSIRGISSSNMDLFLHFQSSKEEAEHASV
jgi:hypothetical protein